MEKSLLRDFLSRKALNFSKDNCRKTFEKTLDKLKKFCYNKDKIKKGRQELPKPMKKGCDQRKKEVQYD